MEPKNTQIDTALPVSKAAQRLGVHPQTLRRYEAEGRIAAFRTPGGARRFSVADIDALKSPHGAATSPDKDAS